MAENKTFEPDQQADYPDDPNGTAKDSKAAEISSDTQYGWFGYRPKCLQRINSPGGFLAILSMFIIGHSMTHNGFIYTATSTIQKRFKFSSFRSGFIASSYDITGVVICIFVTYFGGQSHKTIWIGIGALIYTVGALIFVSPHFLTGLYTYGSDLTETCVLNGTSGNECSLYEGGENLSGYFWVFIAAQVVYAIGASPLYTLGQAYLDENVRTEMSSVYLGILQAIAALAPAVSFVLGAVFLTIYTDISVDRSEIDIKPSSPLWVGAWWLGFLMCAVFTLMSVIPLLGFPRKLPGADNLIKVSEAQEGSAFTVRSGFGNSIKDFPRAAWTLLKNPPFILLNLGVSAEWFILAAISVFGPKFAESQFNISAGLAALLTGILIIPATLIGCIGGGWAIKHFRLGFRGQMKFCIVALFVSFCAMFIFVASCPNVLLAGLNVSYGDGNPQLNVTTYCNAACNCELKYDPVCDINNVTYYSPCFAGCTVKGNYQGLTVYGECTCLPKIEGLPWSARRGKCDVYCKAENVYYFCIFFMFAASFLTIVPSVTGTFRVVDESQKAFALGIQALMMKCLGTVPGPIIFGLLIDKTCLFYEPDCEGSFTCWINDNEGFARYTLILITSARSVSLLCWTGALLTHKPQTTTDDTNGPEVKGKPEVNLFQNKNGAQADMEFNDGIILTKHESIYTDEVKWTKV